MVSYSRSPPAGPDIFGGFTMVLFPTVNSPTSTFASSICRVSYNRAREACCRKLLEKKKKNASCERSGISSKPFMCKLAYIPIARANATGLTLPRGGYEYLFLVEGGHTNTKRHRQEPHKTQNRHRQVDTHRHSRGDTY